MASSRKKVVLKGGRSVRPGLVVRRKSSTRSIRRGWLTRRRLAIGLGTLAFPLLVPWGWLQLDGHTLPGLRVGDHALTRTAQPASKVEAIAEQWLSAQVAIETGPYVTHTTRHTLGGRVDVEAVARRAALTGHTGNPFRDIPDLWAAISGQLRLHLDHHVDSQRLSDFVMALRKRIDRAPVAGTKTSDGDVIEGIPGVTINSVSATSVIRRALNRGETHVEVPTHTVPPPKPTPAIDVEAALYTETLAAFTTEYAQYNRGRARNIEQAIAALDGAVMKPGSALSFNARVGERSIDEGFRPATEIRDRELVEGVGGGVCQAAATLHAAAFLGGMDIVEHHPHSRPVRYIEPGLDTMVWWPTADLKLRNPYPFPVRVHATAQAGTVHVELRGAGKPHPVEWHKEVVRYLRGKRNPSADQEDAVYGRAVDGMLLRRTRTVYLPSGPKTEERMLRYPPHTRSG